jgi:dephospho-CoA kinase
MLRYGLTGGIASGKSTVAKILRELGFPVIEADGIAHDVMEPDQPAYSEVVTKFGDSILDPGKRIARGRPQQSFLTIVKTQSAKRYRASAR